MNTLKTKSVNDGNLAKIAVGKSLLKEYKTSECTRTVYLNDGDEFQIQLFNPETTEIGAEIFIDNEPLSNIIILHPGERMWLERYTDKAKKFKFKVYTVDGDSKAVEKAIAHNGEIKIKFYRKQKPIVIETYSYPKTYIYKEVNPNPWTTIYCNNALDANSINSISGDININYCATTTGDAGKNVSRAMPEIKCFNASMPSASSVSSGGLDFADGSSVAWASTDDNVYDLSLSDSVDNNLIETGRVSEGSKSNQKFESVDIDLEYFPFRTEEFKILPYSRKPYTVNDAKKLYCSNCGHKLNTKFKYCPYCGAEID